MLPSALRCSQVLARTFRYVQVLAGAPRCTHVRSGAFRCIQVPPGARTCVQVLPGALWYSQVLAGAFKSAYPTGTGSFGTNGSVAGIVLAVVIALLVYYFQQAHKKPESDKVQPHSAEFWKQMKTINNAMDQAPSIDMDKIKAAAAAATEAEKTYQKSQNIAPGPRATTPAGGAELAVNSSSAVA